MAPVRIQKPRAFQGTKDIALSLGVLLVVMFLSIGFTGLCSFHPGGADRSGTAQRVDVDTLLQMDAAGLQFPIRNPQMPDNWVPNSARRVQVGQSVSSLVGWVIDGKSYMSLTQTDAPFDKATEPDNSYREPAGTREVGGVQWHVFTGHDVRPIWVADAKDVRLILEGMAPDRHFETAATKVMEAQPIKRG
ncbi:DUF4245 domain-containing protein [Corynebacterium heidelbergense]|uniref:DUF4245 domain-containing protein n=1 Tax=Corynebacterium heidelbergense TaxID=2055947 RepID=A0A364V5M1_9CORY|nr:DUF4245 domain-containing protein [Corynebacterium heidelbergense]RAV31906.1 DUF4245 domain-containing protein [Corynebacterium heidelbergense]